MEYREVIMTQEFIDSFEHDAIFNKEWKEHLPGLLAANVRYIRPLRSFRFHLIVDPRERGDFSFVGSKGYIPILRLDWELSDEGMDGLSPEDILDLANQLVLNDIEHFEETGNLTD